MLKNTFELRENRFGDYSILEYTRRIIKDERKSVARSNKEENERETIEEKIQAVQLAESVIVSGYCAICKGDGTRFSVRGDESLSKSSD